LKILLTTGLEGIAVKQAMRFAKEMFHLDEAHVEKKFSFFYVVVNQILLSM